MSKRLVWVGLILAAGLLAACGPASQPFVCQPSGFGRDYPLGSPAYSFTSVWFTNADKSLWAGVQAEVSEPVARFKYSAGGEWNMMWWLGDGSKFGDALVVHARRLDAHADEVLGYGKSVAPDQRSVTIILPSAGCWELSSTANNHTVTFVMDLAP